MAVERLQTLKLFDHLARLLAGGPAGEAPDDRLVYQERETPEDPDDSWQRRVLEVCDGRSVGEIKSMLYEEELSAGASVVDIGLWRGLFDRSIQEALLRLIYSGHVRLALNSVPKEKRNAKQTAKG